MQFSLHHTCIRVFNLEKSLAFYQEALGFKEIRRSGVENDYVNVFMSDRDELYFIELCYNYNPETPYDLGTGYSHICVTTKDLEAAHQFHVAGGWDVTKIYDYSLYFIMDPDGYRTEVVKK